MTVCPIAIVAGCKKCPIFAVCPLKSTLGDQPKAEDQPESKPDPKPRTGGGKKKKR